MARQLRPGFSFLACLAVGLIPTSLSAQGPLPWSLSQYPDGGPLLTEAVATTLGGNAELTGQTCRALTEGTPQQTASGFAGIALAAFAAPPPTSGAIVEQFPECCARMLGSDVEEIITLGAAVALEARAWGESEIGLGRQIEELVGLCDDEAFARSYEIARGTDDLGVLIAEGTSDGPVSTGSVELDTAGDGGLPSAN